MKGFMGKILGAKEISHPNNESKEIEINADDDVTTEPFDNDDIPQTKSAEEFADDYFNESRNLVISTPKTRKQEQDSFKMAIDTAREFERSIIETKNSRIRMQTKVLVVLGATTLMLGVALIVLTPLKTAVPYLLRVDSTTGYVDKVEPYSVERNTVNEAVVRYFLAKYVSKRESYDWFLIQDMYAFVEETSSMSVFSTYKAFYLDQEYSPLKKLGKSAKINVVINSIVFLSDGTAQVRYTKSIIESDGNKSRQYPETTWIASIAFDFSKEIKTEKQRLENPLGFQIIGYNVDREVVSNGK